MRTVVDPVFLDIMKQATLWIVANQKREKAFLEDADIDNGQWWSLVEALYDEQESE